MSITYEEESNQYCIPISNVGLPVSDSIINTNILFSARNSKISKNQEIWKVAVKDGTQNKILEKSPWVTNGLAYLDDGYSFIVISGFSVFLSDNDGSELREIDSAKEFLSTFAPYTPIWNLLAQVDDIPGADDLNHGIQNSPDGKYAAVWKEGDSELLMRNKQTGEEISILETEDLDFISGNWSPDGNSFLFSVYRNSDDIGNPEYSQVFQVNKDGTNLFALSRKYQYHLVTSPHWSPNGQKVMLAYEDFPEQYMLILDIPSGNESFVEISPYYSFTLLKDGEFVWSPDSAWVIYISNVRYNGIVAVSVLTGESYCIDNLAAGYSYDAMDWK